MLSSSLFGTKKMHSLHHACMPGVVCVVDLWSCVWVWGYTAHTPSSQASYSRSDFRRSMRTSVPSLPSRLLTWRRIQKPKMMVNSCKQGYQRNNQKGDQEIKRHTLLLSGYFLPVFCSPFLSGVYFCLLHCKVENVPGSHYCWAKNHTLWTNWPKTSICTHLQATPIVVASYRPCSGWIKDDKTLTITSMIPSRVPPVMKMLLWSVTFFMKVSTQPFVLILSEIAVACLETRFLEMNGLTENKHFCMNPSRTFLAFVLSTWDVLFCNRRKLHNGCNSILCRPKVHPFMCLFFPVCVMGPSQALHAQRRTHRCFVKDLISALPVFLFRVFTARIWHTASVVKIKGLFFKREAHTKSGLQMHFCILWARKEQSKRSKNCPHLSRLLESHL